MRRTSTRMGKERRALRLLEPYREENASSHCLGFDETPLQENHHKDEHRPKEANGRGITHLAEEECLFIEIKNARERTVGGPTACHNVRFDEKREAADCREQEHKHDRWVEHWHSDQAKFLPGTRAIEFRRFIQVSGNRL